MTKWTIEHEEAFQEWVKALRPPESVIESLRNTCKRKKLSVQDLINDRINKVARSK